MGLASMGTLIGRGFAGGVYSITSQPRQISDHRMAQNLFQMPPFWLFVGFDGSNYRLARNSLRMPRQSDRNEGATVVAKRQAEPDVWVIDETGADELLSLGSPAVAWLLTLQRVTSVEERLGVLLDWLSFQAGVTALRFIDQDGRVRMDTGPETGTCLWWRIAGSEAPGLFRIGDDGVVDVKKLSLILGAAAALLRTALAYERAVRSARRDPLTGLQNREAMEEALLAELDLVARHDAPLTLLVVDIDHFKHINDCFGHRAGDAVLREIAQRLQARSRTGDLVFRYAGDEFVVALRQTDEPGAEHAARRLRHLVERAVIQHEDHIIRVRVSVGAACARAGDTLGTLFERADQAMYRDKADPLRIPLAAGPTRAGEPAHGLQGQ